MSSKRDDDKRNRAEDMAKLNLRACNAEAKVAKLEQRVAEEIAKASDLRIEIQQAKSHAGREAMRAQEAIAARVKSERVAGEERERARAERDQARAEVPPKPLRYGTPEAAPAPVEATTPAP